jgi:hypothetical protein
MTGWILEPCSNPLQTPKFQCLPLEDGETPEWCEAGVVTSDGESWTPNIGEFPNVERESLLSQILEDNVPQKYYLSPKACMGILRRAERRGKELPPMLQTALMAQSGQTAPELSPQDTTAAHAPIEDKISFTTAEETETEKPSIRSRVTTKAW